MAWSLETRVPFLDTVVAELRVLAARRARRCAASRRSGCCGRRSSRCCRARSSTAASAASRSRRPRGCAASSSRSRARRSRRRRCGGRVPAAGGGHARCSTDHVVGPRGPLARSSGACSRSRSGTSGTSRAISASDAALGSEHGAVARPMRVWIDMTASAHPLVFRPLVELLRGARRRGRDHRARVRADAAADRAARDDRRPSIGHHGGRSRLGKARQLTSRLRALRDWARGRGLRPRARARLARADDHGAPARDPELDHVRLRVGLAAAPARLPRRDEGRRPRLDPARAARALRRACRRSCSQYPGLKEEYYLADFEPDPTVLDALGLDPARTLVVLRPPPDVSLYHRHSNPLFPQTLAAPRPPRHVHAFVLPRTDGAARLRPLARAAVGDRSRAGRRRAEPDRARRPRRLRRRDDEPRGGGARRAGLHDLRRPARRRRRGADPQGRLRPLTDPRALELAQARARRPATRVRRDPAELLALLLSAYDA